MRKRYGKINLVQLKKELQELKSLSTYATSLSCYIYLNLTGMAKIMKKFEKKFKRYNFNFTKNFVIEKYLKKNSDLLYIHQYKILDEVGACVEQLKNELTDRYDFLIRNKIGLEDLDKIQPEPEEDNINIINEGLLNDSNNSTDINIINTSTKNNNNKEQITREGLEKIKEDFNALNKSIGNMEAFYHSIFLIFEVWMRQSKETWSKKKVI